MKTNFITSTDKQFSLNEIEQKTCLTFLFISVYKHLKEEQNTKVQYNANY